MRNQKWRADVDGKDFVPLFSGDCFYICGFKYTSIIDEQINLPEMLQDGLNCLLDAFGPAQIAFERNRLNSSSFYLFQCLCGFVRRRAIGKCNVRASLCHGKRDSFAQTPRRAGDENRFAIQIGHASIVNGLKT